MRDDSRRYNWLKKASKEQILLDGSLLEARSIDTALRASMVAEDQL
jgi:hypothetical protein